MEIDVENRRQVALLTLGVVAVMVVASVGFATLSDNPLVPDATFAASDADNEYDLNRTGTVEMLVIEHTGGESVALSDVVVLLGSRTSGTRFNTTADWQIEAGELTYTARLNGEPINDSDEFTPGDRIVVAKTSGTAGTFGEFETRVRLLHLPSRNTLLDEQVTIE
jgi:hypothetical protein